VLCLFLCLADTWKWALIRMATQVGIASIRATIRKGMGMRHERSGWDRSFFCALQNLSDCARLEMLQTDFRREMGCSGSFASVRGLPRNGSRVSSRVFPDDFGK